MSLSFVSWGIPILNVQECQSCSQFQSIVSCYKPSRSILNIFEPILKAYIAQSFICCLFYLLWTSVKISSQEAKGPISLSANIADMWSFNCDSDPNILDTFDILEDRSLQSIWSMDLFDPFPCYLHHITFDRLKSHTPFPYQASQLVYIFLKFQCVLCILNFSVAITVIRKESYFRINVCWDIVNVQRKKKGPRTVPCGTPDKTGANPILPRSQQLAVVCSTEKTLSISVSSHLCHS